MIVSNWRQLQSCWQTTGISSQGAHQREHDSRPYVTPKTSVSDFDWSTSDRRCLRQRERHQGIAVSFLINLGMTARGDHDKLLPTCFIRDWKRMCAGGEGSRPEFLAVVRREGTEAPVHRSTHEDQSASSHDRPAKRDRSCPNPGEGFCHGSQRMSPRDLAARNIHRDQLSPRRRRAWRAGRCT